MERRDARVVGPAWLPPLYKAPAFAEWADPATDQLSQTMRRPDPCPLCAHPSYDCTVHLAGPVLVDITPLPIARPGPHGGHTS